MLNLLCTCYPIFWVLLGQKQSESLFYQNYSKLLLNIMLLSIAKQIFKWIFKINTPCTISSIVFFFSHLKSGKIHGFCYHHCDNFSLFYLYILKLRGISIDIVIERQTQNTYAFRGKEEKHIYPSFSHFSY